MKAWPNVCDLKECSARSASLDQYPLTERRSVSVGQPRHSLMMHLLGNYYDKISAFTQLWSHIAACLDSTTFKIFRHLSQTFLKLAETVWNFLNDFWNFLKLSKTSWTLSETFWNIYETFWHVSDCWESGCRTGTNTFWGTVQFFGDLNNKLNPVMLYRPICHHALARMKIELSASKADWCQASKNTINSAKPLMSLHSGRFRRSLPEWYDDLHRHLQRLQCGASVALRRFMFKQRTHKSVTILAS